jgi:chemosensory pili system protein ChpA (sensor histidine kinase/response regulator)
MTTHSSGSPQGARDNFDTGPLSWVMGEIRECLARSKAAVEEAVTQDAEAQLTALRHAKTYLHQAHGALQIVDIDGVSILTETTEEMLDRIDSGQLKFSQDAAQAITSTCQAVTEYLEELLAGAQHQPVRLFPYYKALLEVRGAERIHPADLFFPNLAIRPQLPLADAAASASDYAVLRQRFERALLPFLRSADQAAEQASAAAMSEVVASVGRMQTNQQSRGFWWVLQGFTEAVSLGQIKNEVYVKQLLARVNLQIRRLSEGSSSIGERLLRDALFFVARVENPSPLLQQIRTAYQLDGLVPADYDKKRYGQIDAASLANAKERLSQAKNMWNRIIGGDTGAVPAFEQEMAALTEAGAKLSAPSLSKLLRELGGIARHAARSNANDNVGLEVATSLLFVENALNHTSRLTDNFAARADAMTARLLAIVAGQQPADSAQWLDDMSREAQQRETMLALAAEMQTNLGQVEKMLDEYFSNPAKRTSLVPIDSVLHQIQGALAILDQDDAVRAVAHTRAEVKRFAEADPDAVPSEAEFQHVAQNVGALSFFIETLQLHSEGVKKRFSFDDKLGIFQANLVKKNEAPNAPFEYEVAVLSEPATDDSNITSVVFPDSDQPTVETELAQRQQESAELAISLATAPDNPVLQEQLKESLVRVRADAALLDNLEAKERAATAIEILERTDFADSADALAEIVAATAPPAPLAEPEPVAAPAVQSASDESVDAELLEIFLSEAQEVLDCVKETVPLLRNEASNQEHMTTLRRSFHTLKGSGRMVGLMSFGDAAWSIEQVLNRKLSEGKGGTPDLFSLLDKAAELLDAWVMDLQTQARSDRTPTALINAAERIKNGEAFLYEESAGASADAVAEISFIEETAEAAGVTDPQPVADTSDPAFDLPQVEETQMSDAELAVFHIEEAAATVRDESDKPAEIALDLPTLDLMPTAEVINFREIPVVTPPHDDNIKRIGTLEISVPLHNIYTAETDELVRLLAHDIEEWQHEPERQVNILAVHAAHSLAGSSATVGFESLHEAAYALEMVLQTLARKPVRLFPGDYGILSRSVECLKQMLKKFALCEMPEHEPDLVRTLEALREEINERAGNVTADPDSTVPAFDAADIEIDVSSVEPIPPSSAESATPPYMVDRRAPQAESMPELSADSLAKTAEKIPGPRFERQQEAIVDQALMPKDDLDADLLPVFLEEGNDILPQMGTLLRAWQEQPADSASAQSLLRHLHTLKGSARMAGAMALGQHMHDIETRIEQITRSGIPSSAAIEELLGRLDQGLYVFEQLQNPGASTPTPAVNAEHDRNPQSEGVSDTDGRAGNQDMVVLQPLMPVSGTGSAKPVPITATGQLPATAASATAASVALVRVRADILDRLVNQAGEVSISRSRVETEVDTLRQSLSELTENVSRLRGQLREIEIQAESQMSSQMAHSVDRGFDPLEFDRFTRLQELTRMMAESVNDVVSVQQNLAKTIDGASTDLASQARLTRDLQQDLMRVRMVQFASISERLYRVTRQASKEVDKRINLDIRGTSVEVDRSVLERMAGPFEHLLRNAIVHGIESRERRIAAGKSEVGELLVEIRQEGNEVVIQFSDDGQGLNLARIREKARATGLLPEDTELGDAELKDLIFHPGFSTAQEVTELAGRGVGMDVVRAEAAALGGRIAIVSEEGKGAQFIIQLPLTLAVTQVVLLATGGKTYAVPSVLVEQVQQLKANALAAAYNEGAVIWNGNRVPMYYLSGLLGDINASPLAQQYSPLVILKSGNDRVAIHVDAIMGNREVVVKNIGPQLARMIGIAGATVLGSGDIVLILDPVPLAQRAINENARAPRLSPSDAPDNMGAVAEMAVSAPVTPKSEPVQGLRTQRIVMVVDDSLTVRRVTQRFLVREGYQVVLAKDGVDALEQLQAIKPDVMLVDIEMPRMDGFDLTRNVRSDERTRQIPIIMITSRTATKHRNYAMELGVNEYLGKPYQETELLRLVNGFIEKEAPIA